MIMNKIHVNGGFAKSFSAYLMLCLLTLSVFSCDRKEEDVFEQSSSERISEVANKVRKQLTSAKYGWILNYVPNSQQLFGGYTMAVQFGNDGFAVITSEEMFAKDKQGYNLPIVWSKGMYQIEEDSSITLNFDTGNAALDFFAKPGTNNGLGTGKGFEGDYEFMVMKSDNPDVILLKGKKSFNLMELRRAKEPLAQYMGKVRYIKEQAFSSALFSRKHFDAFVGKVGGQEVAFSPKEDGSNVYIMNSTKKTDDKATEGVFRNEPLPFFYTTTGVEFLKPIAGIKGFTWSEAEECFLAQNGDKFVGRKDPDYPAYAKFLGDYTLRIGEAGQEQDYDVTFVEAGRNRYLITGLSYNLLATFNPQLNAFEIKTAVLDQQNLIALCVWAAPDEKGLTALPLGGSGMYSRLVEGTTNTYEMVDNGVWGDLVAKSFIVFRFTEPQGVPDNFKPARLVLPKFIHK